MKTTFTTTFVTLALAFQARAYLSVPDGALNVRHFHMVERGETGEIVGRSFLNTFDLVERDEYGVLEKRKCTTINACGTPGGCMMMAGQRYCDGVPWQKSFQDAVKQTGANGRTGLKIMAEGIGRGPVGMIAGAAKATAKALIDAKKTGKKAEPKKKEPKKKEPKKKEPKKSSKKKRELVDENVILNQRDFEIVERDEDFNLVERGQYSTFDVVNRDESGSIVAQRCEMFNGDMSCQ